jgi:hypothetical protein
MNEPVDVILDRLISEAVAAGRFTNQAQVLKAVGLSSGYMGELRQRTAKNPDATLNLDTAVKFADVLGCPVTLLTGDTPAPSGDPYEGRSWAIIAARALGLPESAIQTILAEDPGHDPGKLWWFKRIEAEGERLVPASGFDR